jgi:O-antigen/teichoic acid export membrane protein
MNFRNFSGIKELFFANQSTRQTIFKNTFWFYAGRGISNVSSFILMVYIARILGANEYGRFTFALAFVSLFGVLADLGISTILIREFAGSKEREHEFQSLLSLKMFLGALMLMVVSIGSFFITADPGIRKMIWILALYMLINNGFLGMYYSFFQARQKMEYQAFSEIFLALATMAICFPVLFNIPSAQNLSYSYLSSTIATLVFVSLLFHFKITPLKISWNREIYKKFLMMSWPLTFISILNSIFTNTDSVMLGAQKQITQGGWYNAAYRISLMSSVFVGIVSGSFFPALSESFKNSMEKLQRIWNYQMEVITVLAFPLMVGGIALAAPIIEFAYGHDFAPAIPAFQILMVMAGVGLLYAPFYHALIVSHEQKKSLWAVLSGVTLNVILNIILIPRYSLYGAAIASVIGQLLIFISMFWLVVKFTPIRIYSRKFLPSFIGICLASLIMYFTVTQPQIYRLNALISILTGAAVYLGCFLAYKKLKDKLKIT